MRKKELSDMDKACITHHHACFCREKKIRLVCESLITIHEKEREQMSRDSKYQILTSPCECDVCKVAKLLIKDN